jgi:hypothetical protein
MTNFPRISLRPLHSLRLNLRVIYLRLSLLAFVFSLLLSGCAAPVGNSENAFDHYLNEETTMLVISPGATEASENDVKEITLHKGDRVRLIERGGTTTLIETMKGDRGRVPTIDLEATDENSSDEPQAKMGKSIRW